MVIPTHVKKYFWDADIKDIDLKKRASYVIERVLEYGDEKAFAWLKRNVRQDLIKRVLMESRSLSPQGANFWAFVLGVPRNKILCLKRRFRERRSRHWIW